MNIGSKYNEDCILCSHRLDVHKIEVYSFTDVEEGKTYIGYRIRCHNDDKLEGGYYHCSCDCGFSDIIYNINITKMENNKK
jgi:hypothetical protein